MKLHPIIFIVIFLQFSSKKIQSQRDNFAIDFDNRFNLADKIHFEQFFDRMKQELPVEIIQEVEDYENLKLAREGDPLDEYAHRIIQNQKKEEEIRFFVEMLSHTIEPLTKYFDTSSVYHIIKTLSEKMVNTYNVFPDNIRNSFGKLTHIDWNFVIKLSFMKYDMFLTDAKNQFKDFPYNHHDKQLFQRLFDFFGHIMSEKYYSLYNNGVAHYDDNFPTITDSKKKIKDEELPGDIAHAVDDTRKMKNKELEEIKEVGFEANNQKNTQSAPTEKSSPKSNLLGHLHSPWMRRLMEVISDVIQSFRTCVVGA